MYNKKGKIILINPIPEYSMLNVFIKADDGYEYIFVTSKNGYPSYSEADIGQRVTFNDNPNNQDQAIRTKEIYKLLGMDLGNLRAAENVKKCK